MSKPTVSFSQGKTTAKNLNMRFSVMLNLSSNEELADIRRAGAERLAAAQEDGRAGEIARAERYVQATRDAEARARALVKAAAQKVAAQAEARYASLGFSIPVRAKQVANTFVVEVTGDDNAQKWARILEHGYGPTSMENIVRMAKRKRPIAIYRAKRGKNGQMYLRNPGERAPGYYLIIPRVFGTARRNDKGKIVIDSISDTHRGLRESDGAAVQDLVATPVGTSDYRSEPGSDPQGLYPKQGFTRSGSSPLGTYRYALDANGDPVPTDDRRPGTVVNENMTQEWDGVNYRQRIYKPGEFVRDKDPTTGRRRERYFREGYVERDAKYDGVNFVDRESTRFTSRNTAKLMSRLGVTNLRVVDPDAALPETSPLRGVSMQRRGSVVSFRTVSTRKPSKPLPGRAGHHILSDAQAQIKAELRAEISRIERNPKGGGGRLSHQQQVALQILRGAL